MKVSKAIKLCKRTKIAKDKAQHKKDVDDLRSRGYTDRQYQSMIDMHEQYKRDNPESILNQIPWANDAQYRDGPVEIEYEAIKPLKDTEYEDYISPEASKYYQDAIIKAYDDEILRNMNDEAHNSLKK